MDIKHICIVCGKPAFLEGRCKSCILKKEIFNIKDFGLVICDLCGSFYSDRKWHEKEDIKDVIKEHIKKRIQAEAGARIKKIGIDFKTAGNRYITKVLVEGVLHGLQKKEEKNLIVTTKYIKCINCSKMLGGYYEAVIQVRGEDAEKIMEYIEKILPKDSVTRIEKRKEGYDIKLMNKGIAKKIARIFGR